MKKIFIDTNIALDLLFENALYSNFKDKEDGYQYFTAKEYGIPIVVTRNVKDFVVDDISVLTPEQFLSMYRVS